MNLSNALNKARKANKAIKLRSSNDDYYVYHGMDNVLWEHNPFWSQDRIMTLSIASLINHDWVLCDTQPYHGPLVLKEKSN